MGVQARQAWGHRVLAETAAPCKGHRAASYFYPCKWKQAICHGLANAALGLQPPKVMRFDSLWLEIGLLKIPKYSKAISRLGFGSE